MRLFVLARHGQSELNVTQRVNGDPSVRVALTSLGSPALVQAIGVEGYGTFVSSHTTCAHTYAATPTGPSDWVAIIQHGTTISAGGSVNFRGGYRLL